MAAVEERENGMTLTTGPWMTCCTRKTLWARHLKIRAWRLCKRAFYCM
jgi:hypothetical protein